MNQIARRQELGDEVGYLEEQHHNFFTKKLDKRWDKRGNERGTERD
jgi:hypothetical protein